VTCISGKVSFKRCCPCSFTTISELYKCLCTFPPLTPNHQVPRAAEKAAPAPSESQRPGSTEPGRGRGREAERERVQNQHPRGEEGAGSSGGGTGARTGAAACCQPRDDEGLADSGLQRAGGGFRGARPLAWAGGSSPCLAACRHGTGGGPEPAVTELPVTEPAVTELPVTAPRGPRSCSQPPVTPSETRS